MKCHTMIALALFMTGCATDGADVAYDFIDQTNSSELAFPCMDECEVEECCHVCFEAVEYSEPEYEQCCGLCADQQCVSIKAMPAPDPVAPTMEPSAN